MVETSVLCREVVPISEGPLLEVPLHTSTVLPSERRRLLSNPRRACAARGSVCLSVKSHLTYGASVRPENAVTYSAGNEGQNMCGVFSETAPLQRSSTPSIVRPCVQSAIFPEESMHTHYSMGLAPPSVFPSRRITRRMFNIDGEREQANWDMAAILELQSVPFSFRNKTGRAAYCKKIIESMCVKLR